MTIHNVEIPCCQPRRHYADRRVFLVNKALHRRADRDTHRYLGIRIAAIKLDSHEQPQSGSATTHCSRDDFALTRSHRLCHSAQKVIQTCSLFHQMCLSEKKLVAKMIFSFTH